MNTPTTDTPATNASTPAHAARPRRGAIGKALLVWLFSGSAVLGLIALLAFGAIGC